MSRLASLVGVGVIAGLMFTPLARAEEETAETLNTQIIKLYGEGKYAEAIPLAQRALAIREKTLGPHHIHVAMSLSTVARLYQAQGHHADAEPLYLDPVSKP